MYYNTTKLEGEDLKKEEKNAKTQDSKILWYFKLNNLGEAWRIYGLTPWEVHLHFKQWPITSIRRSINTLSKNTYDVKCTFIGEPSRKIKVKANDRRDAIREAWKLSNILHINDPKLIQPAPLEKTSEMREGMYGKREHVWRLKK